MQIMFENDLTLRKKASMGDYTIKKKDKASLGNSNILEKNDVSVMSQKELPSLNDKRPLHSKPYGKT